VNKTLATDDKINQLKESTIQTDVNTPIGARAPAEQPGGTVVAEITTLSKATFYLCLTQSPPLTQNTSFIIKP